MWYRRLEEEEEEEAFDQNQFEKNDDLLLRMVMQTVGEENSLPLELSHGILRPTERYSKCKQHTMIEDRGIITYFFHVDFFAN